MKKIYIVLTHTGTVLATTIRIFTGSKFTHSSIGLDENLEELYSFGRLNPYNPIIGGFVKEGIHIGTFKRFKKTKTKIFSFEVEDEKYEKLKANIDEMYKEKEKYKFNIIGLAIALFRIQPKFKNRFYCSEFVRYILEKSGINPEGLENVIRPQDFLNMKTDKLEYEGLLCQYDAKEKLIAKCLL